MTEYRPEKIYCLDRFRHELDKILNAIAQCNELATARSALMQYVIDVSAMVRMRDSSCPSHILARSRDCSRAMMNTFYERSDEKAGFSVTQALWDVARGKARPDLQFGFFAEFIKWTKGIEARSDFHFIPKIAIPEGVSGRDAANLRSRELDIHWQQAYSTMKTYTSGLEAETLARREARKQYIMSVLGAGQADWDDWRWQVNNLVTSANNLARLTHVEDQIIAAINRAKSNKIPFGITPYYVSLMDDEASARDRAIRAQVIPTTDYIQHMVEHKGRIRQECDFMLEADTSPIDLVTRRYPAVLILKPYNTCPQICVYCQRNWEIDDVMMPQAMAQPKTIESAINWIADHPAIREVLITGGDPFVMESGYLKEIVGQLACIENIDLIRIGSRTLVTLPMRSTDEFVGMLGRFRQPGRLDLAIITHFEHPYEITPDTIQVVERMRRNGISVYNQQVYTFYASRRYESTYLRMLLRRAGIAPYYTFALKGKKETENFRVPLARMLQEIEEEARLLPGLRRTDEAVYNVPGLGKNYLRAAQHRDLLSVLPGGERVYEFHPWEKAIAEQNTYVSIDLAIVEYLKRLVEIGEDPENYDSIWYYF